MKRLLDEPTDEVTRLLIRAGANHQPPRSGKLRLLASLGFGSALGLSAREALGWFGTGSGKVALAATVFGVVGGGVYALTHTSGAEPRGRSPNTPALMVTAPPMPRPAAKVAPEAVAANAAPPLAESSPTASHPTRRVTRPPKTARVVRPPTLEEPTLDAPTSVTPERRRLMEETLWVDRLRVAAESGDRAGFERLKQAYAEQFPDGQLRPEVNRLRDIL